MIFCKPALDWTATAAGPHSGRSPVAEKARSARPKAAPVYRPARAGGLRAADNPLAGRRARPRL